MSEIVEQASSKILRAHEAIHEAERILRELTPEEIVKEYGTARYPSDAQDHAAALAIIRRSLFGTYLA